MVSLKHGVPDGFCRDEYKSILIDTSVKRLWAVELDLLAEFDRVCRQNNLKYSIAYGTLLGAVRHQGFIPWDNDVDVVMLREDYDRLCAISAKVFKSPYFLQTDSNSPMAARGHAQLRNSDTTGILNSEMIGGHCFYRFNQGIFIDVFPLDAVPDDEKKMAEFRKDVVKIKKKISRRRYSLGAYANFGKIKSGYRSTVRGALFSWLGINLESLNRGLELLARRYEHDTASTRVAPISFRPMMTTKWVYKRELFSELVELPFENLQVFAPRRYEEILRINYGDWHKHVVGGDLHGGMLVDVDRPYTEYLEI